MASDTITVLYGSRAVEYPAWQLDDQFSQLWEDHHAAMAAQTSLHARCVCKLATAETMTAARISSAYQSARDAARHALKAMECRDRRAARNARIRPAYIESAISGAIGADGYCYSDADPGM